MVAKGEFRDIIGRVLRDPVVRGSYEIMITVTYIVYGDRSLCHHRVLCHHKVAIT